MVFFLHGEICYSLCDVFLRILGFGRCSVGLFLCIRLCIIRNLAYFLPVRSTQLIFVGIDFLEIFHLCIR